MNSGVPGIDRPEICFINWGAMPESYPVPHRDGQTGLFLRNDGRLVAHEISIEPIEISASVTAHARKIAQIPKDGIEFVPVWMEGYERKWDVSAAMAEAALRRPGSAVHRGDFCVKTRAKYRDSRHFWYRSLAELMYLPALHRLEFGPATVEALGFLHSESQAARSQSVDGSMETPAISRPRLPVGVLAAIGDINGHARSALDRSTPGDGFTTKYSLDIKKITEILLSCAVESFRARQEFYEKDREFSPSWTNDTIDDTVNDAFGLIPLDFGGNLLWENMPPIRAALVSELKEIASKRAEIRMSDQQGSGTVSQPLRAVRDGAPSTEAGQNPVKISADYCSVRAIEEPAAAVAKPNTREIRFAPDAPCDAAVEIALNRLKSKSGRIEAAPPFIPAEVDRDSSQGAPANIMNFLTIEQENGAANRAFDVLKLQPRWANVQERLATANIRHSRLAEDLRDLRLRRREALRHFTLQATTYLDLVKDNPTADAFCNLLPFFVREAFTFSCGFPPQVMRPVLGDEKEFERKIEFRFRRWTAKAYQRAQLQSAKSNTFSAELADDQFRKQPTKTTVPLGKTVSLARTENAKTDEKEKQHLANAVAPVLVAPDVSGQLLPADQAAVADYKKMIGIHPLGPMLWSRFNLAKTAKTSPYRDLLIYHHVSISIESGTSNRDLVERIAGESRIPVESLTDALDTPIFSRGRVVFGYAGDEFDAVAADYNQMEWWVSDNGLNMAVCPVLTRIRPPSFDEIVSNALPEPFPQHDITSAEAPAAKGNLAILRGPDGNLKRAVTLETARRFAGVSRRAIDEAARRRILKTEGTHTHRKVIVASLLEYCPSEE